MLLQGRNAIIYGAGGAIGGGMARAFAQEGARIFLTGRNRRKLNRVAKQIRDTGGTAEVAVVDVLDGDAVDAHARAVVDQAGSLDISFNLASRGDVHGTPLVEMSAADFIRPILNGLTSNFHTARAAGRHMIAQGSGVILALDSGSAIGSPMMGGTGPADAATDTLVRNLAAELGPHGIRVVGIWTAGVRDTLTARKITAVNRNLKLNNAAFQGLLEQLDGMRLLRRSPLLAQVGAAAAFLASDRAAAITGTFVNVTSGMFTS
jgi:NAD(P)-dependent dehydrogenase (short-subunit alcohol dehydrogenase family)